MICASLNLDFRIVRLLLTDSRSNAGPHGGQVITKLPFENDYRRWVQALDAAELKMIRDELNRVFDSSEIETAGWIPGGDWRGTVYQPIYEKPAQRNPEIAARIFGLIVFKVAMDRPDKWVTGRFEMNGEAIRSRTYFRPGNPGALIG